MDAQLPRFSLYRNTSALLLPSALFAAGREGGGVTASWLCPLAAIQDALFAAILNRKFLDCLALLSERDERTRLSGTLEPFRDKKPLRLLSERDGRTRFSGTLETLRDKASSPGQVAQKVVAKQNTGCVRTSLN